jgi:hypothetical protein
MLGSAGLVPRLAYTVGASTLEVRFVAEGGGTRVSLEHRDLPPDERPGHATGWSHYLARLAMAPVGDPGPDPGMIDGPGRAGAAPLVNVERRRKGGVPAPPAAG